MDKGPQIKNIEIHVHKCARCGNSHDVEFFRFSINPVKIGGVPFYYWGECPVTYDPVFMNFTHSIILENYQQEEE